MPEQRQFPDTLELLGGKSQGLRAYQDGSLLLERNDEWAVRRARYMTLETMAPLSDNATVSPPVVAR